MIQIMTRRSHSIIILSILLGIYGCSTPYNAPDYIRSPFSELEIDTLYVMPVLDFRFDKDFGPYKDMFLNLDGRVKNGAEKLLYKKAYKCIWIMDVSLIDNISKDEFSHGHSWLKDLEPSNARWLLFFTLENIGNTQSLQLTGYLFDKSTRLLIWKNMEVVSGPILYGGIEFATENIIKGLPNN